MISISDAVTPERMTRPGRMSPLGYEAEALGAAAPFFLAAQRAFIDAASLALPSAVRPPFFPLGWRATGPLVEGVVVSFALAQRAFAAAAILARASADIVRRPLV